MTEKIEEALEEISSSANRRKLGLGGCCFLSATEPDGRSDDHD
jgi:hypothetical protein